MSKYNSNGNCKFNISFHIVWIPKYRKHILVNAIELRLKELLNEKILSLELNLVAIECMPDHVHLFIKSKPTVNISFVIKMLKGYTSRVLRCEFYCLRKLKSLWAPGYFCESIGNITEKTVIKYISNQKNI
ncbi:MAG: IS200/IS605 family transposase [Bacteroidetes bacterium]|nr:IS200/IS605 family transposase [Bacteroidota bacterium]